MLRSLSFARALVVRPSVQDSLEYRNALQDTRGLLDRQHGQPATSSTSTHRTKTCTSDLSGVMGLELAHCTHWRLLHLAWRAGRQAHRRAGALAHWRSGAAVWRFSVPAVLPQCFCHTQSSPEFFLPSSKGNLKLAYTFGVRHRAPNPHSLPPNPHGAHDDRTQGYREDAHAHDGDYPPPASPAVSRQARLD